MGSVIDEMVGDEETKQSEDKDQKPAAIAQPQDQNVTGLGSLMVDPSFSFQTQGAQTHAATTAIQTAMGMDNTFQGLYAGQHAMDTNVATAAAPVTHGSSSAMPVLSLPRPPLSPQSFSRSSNAPLRGWMNEQRQEPLSL